MRPVTILTFLNFHGVHKSKDTFSYFLTLRVIWLSLRKLACSNKLKFSPPKTESLQIKILIFFIFLLKILIVGTS